MCRRHTGISKLFEPQRGVGLQMVNNIVRLDCNAQLSSGEALVLLSLT